MIVQVMSDLHLEMHKDYGAGFVESLDPSGVDVLVLAGDIVCFAQRYYPHAHLMLERFCKRWPTVVYVPGNHEYYGLMPSQVHGALEGLQQRNENFCMLYPGKAHLIAGRRFIGGTLWFPHDPYCDVYENRINDFRLIKRFKPWVYDYHTRTRGWIDSMVAPGDVVVTHHLPHPLSVSAKHAGDPLNRYFLADCTDMIEAKAPALWVHGHTHTSCDYKITGSRGVTRVVANVLGYPNETDAGPFNERLLIEV